MSNGRTGITEVRKKSLISRLDTIEEDQELGVRFGQLATPVYDLMYVATFRCIHRSARIPFLLTECLLSR